MFDFAKWQLENDNRLGTAKPGVGGGGIPAPVPIANRGGNPMYEGSGMGGGSPMMGGGQPISGGKSDQGSVQALPQQYPTPGAMAAGGK